MTIPPLINDLALILISAGLTTIIFKWLKQPVVLGYIVAGCLVSSQITLTPTVSGVSDIGTWADIGVVFLLFSLGLDFSFKKLFKVGRTAIISAVVIVTFMIVLGFFVGMAMGWGMTNSFLLGGMISMSSTAIIIKAFDDMGLKSQKFTKIVFGILIVEDLIAILLMVLISTIFVGKSFEGSELLLGVFKLAFFLVVWMIFGIYFIPIILRKAKKFLNDETLLVFALGLCFGMVLFAMKVGFSSALGAFVMGSIFAETLEAERIEKLVLPMKDIFGAIFFVSVGMMVDFNVILEYALPILILVLTVVIGQISLAIIGLLLSGQNLKTTIQSSFCLTQIGEFAFIIAMLGANLGIIDEFIYPVIVAVSVITIFVTPYVMKLSDPFYEFLNRKLPESWKLHLENRGKWKAEKEENVWNSLLSQIAKIVAIYSILSIAVVSLSLNYLKPVVLSYLPNFWGELLVAAVTIILISPFLRAIVWKKNHSQEYKYLWAKSHLNRIPLIALVVVRFLGVFAIVAFVLVQIFNVHVGLAIMFACLLVFLMVASKRLKLFSINLERKFQYNLNSRDYELSKKKVGDSKGRAVFASSLSSDVHLVDFTLSSNATCAGKSLCELNYRKKYGVHIVSILRGGYRINIPGGAEILYPMDKVLALGTDEQLEIFQNAIHDVLEDCAYSENVSVKQFEITKDSPFYGKTLRKSGVRESQGCMIIRIDRDGETIVNPDPDIVFTDNDVVWIVGENSALQKVVDDEKHNVRTIEEC